MSLLRTSSAARLFVGLFVTAGIFTYYMNSLPPLASPMDQEPSPGPIAGISVSVRQKSASPPTVSVRVTNTNPHPVTFLSYGSPLDGLVLQLGLLAITPDGGGAPLELPALEVQRKWPPDRDALITLAAGEGQQQDVVLREELVSPESVGAKATVQLRGRWQAVWGKAKEDIGDESVRKAGIAEDAYSGEFASNEAEIVVTSWKS